MRFIGNKERIIENIYSILKEKNICGESICDLFSGTTNVARYFKKKNYQVVTSDLLYFSYCLQNGYIVNNSLPEFDALRKEIKLSNYKIFVSPVDDVVEYLNNLKPVKGFIYNNYTPGGTANLESPRKYFTDSNGMKIDAIRIQIEVWKKSGLITDSEYYVLLSCLIEAVPFFSNISGVYAAFNKKWDPRALKDFSLKSIEIITNEHVNYAYNVNGVELAEEIKCDILYLDPPYNERQYAPNYHILETIAKYDNPVIRGVTGMRDYLSQKSKFCNPNLALIELEQILSKARYKFFVLSYSSEGIMPSASIKELMSNYGKVDFVEFEYLRYKSNNNGSCRKKKHVFEQLYILRK